MSSRRPAPGSAVVPLVTAALLAPGPAAAEGTGVVVQLLAPDVPTTAAVTVTATPKGGEPVDVVLRNDGTSPDLTAADATWAGAVSLTADEVDLLVTVDGAPRGTASARWEPETRMPRLDLDLLGNDLHAVAAGAEGPRAPPSRRVQAIAPSSLAVGACAGILAGIGIVVTLTRTAGRPPLPVGLVRLAPPPSPDDPVAPGPALTVWGCEGLRDGAAGAAVDALLVRHRVLVVAGDDVPLPLTGAGSVFRLHPDDADHVARRLRDLPGDPTRPAVVLAVADRDDAAAWTEFLRDLPGQQPRVLLVPSDVDGACDARIVRAGAGWALRTAP